MAPCAVLKLTLIFDLFSQLFQHPSFLVAVVVVFVVVAVVFVVVVVVAVVVVFVVVVVVFVVVVFVVLSSQKPQQVVQDEGELETNVLLMMLWEWHQERGWSL